MDLTSKLYILYDIMDKMDNYHRKLIFTQIRKAYDTQSYQYRELGFRSEYRKRKYRQYQSAYLEHLDNGIELANRDGCTCFSYTLNLDSNRVALGEGFYAEQFHILSSFERKLRQERFWKETHTRIISYYDLTDKMHLHKHTFVYGHFDLLYYSKFMAYVGKISKKLPGLGHVFLCVPKEVLKELKQAHDSTHIKNISLGDLLKPEDLLERMALDPNEVEVLESSGIPIGNVTKEECSDDYKTAWSNMFPSANSKGKREGSKSKRSRKNRLRIGGREEGYSVGAGEYASKGVYNDKYGAYHVEDDCLDVNNQNKRGKAKMSLVSVLHQRVSTVTNIGIRSESDNGVSDKTVSGRDRAVSDCGITVVAHDTTVIARDTTILLKPQLSSKFQLAFWETFLENCGKVSDKSVFRNRCFFNLKKLILSELCSSFSQRKRVISMADLIPLKEVSDYRIYKTISAADATIYGRICMRMRRLTSMCL